MTGITVYTPNVCESFVKRLPRDEVMALLDAAKGIEYIIEPEYIRVDGSHGEYVRCTVTGNMRYSTIAEHYEIFGGND